MIHLLSFCLLLTVPPPDTLPYDMSHPSLTINLVNEELKEISGLSPTDSAGIYLAIADEKGDIFFVDGTSGAVIRKVHFRDKGDFEGVEMVGKCLYAVKSSGKVYEIGRWKKENPRVFEFDTPLKKEDDVEGLGYDLKRQSLLLACKGNPDSSYLRKIYAFDLDKKRLEGQPVYTIDPLEVQALVPNEAEDKPHYFSPSGVAIQPVTGDVYVLSTAKKCLVVLDYNSGKIKYAVRLDKRVLPQPEGISFDKRGNMVLSSEGKKGEGLMYIFNYN